MTAPRLDLAELRRLHEEATPGPWESSIAGIEGDNYVAGTGPWHRVTFNECASQYDAALIAAMRNALPALLSIAEAAEAFMSEEHDCDDDQPCLYHDALSAALAAVRKEEKGD